MFIIPVLVVTYELRMCYVRISVTYYVRMRVWHTVCACVTSSSLVAIVASTSLQCRPCTAALAWAHLAAR